MMQVLDNDLPEEQKIDLMLHYLIDGKHPNDPGLLNVICELLFPKQKKRGDDQKSFDFVQDSAYIYASFRQAYNINLFHELGKMHWWEFRALLDGLPENTRLARVIHIRTRELPKPTKHNAKERAEIMRLKQLYALEISAEERERNLQNGLRKMAAAMLQMAEKHGQGKN